MICLLGGPPRVGKSKISRLITAKHGISSVSTDSLGAVLENVLDSKTAPGLFAVSRFDGMPLADRIDLMVEETRRRIDLQIEECRATWRAVAPFIRREAEEGRDVLVEGVAVLPELVARLDDTDCRVVFVGHRGESHEENIRRGAAEDDRDWMRDAGDDYIHAFAVFVKQMSHFLAKEAHEHGFAYIEMSEMPFAAAVDAVIRSLPGKDQVSVLAASSAPVLPHVLDDACQGRSGIVGAGGASSTKSRGPLPRARRSTACLPGGCSDCRATLTARATTFLGATVRSRPSSHLFL